LQLELLTFGQFCKGVKSSVTFEKNPLVLNHVTFYTTTSHCVGREFPGIRMRQQKQWLATKIVGMLLIICCGDSKSQVSLQQDMGAFHGSISLSSHSNENDGMVFHMTTTTHAHY
jgi:hypothetical protein